VGRMHHEAGAHSVLMGDNPFATSRVQSTHSTSVPFNDKNLRSIETAAGDASRGGTKVHASSRCAAVSTGNHAISVKVRQTHCRTLAGNLLGSKKDCRFVPGGLSCILRG